MKKNILVLFLFASALYSEKISSIRVVGTKNLTEDFVIFASGLKIGDEFSYPALEDAIKNLFRRGEFKDITARGEQTQTGIALEFEVEENPTIEGIEFSGNKNIKKQELEQSTGLSKGEFVNPQKIKEASSKIEELYRKKGYNNISVEPKTFESREGRVLIKFNIDEGEKTRIKKIIIEGVHALKENEVKKKLGLHEKSLIRSGKFDRNKYEKGKEKIIACYNENGYLDASLVGDSIWAKGKDQFVKLVISEGAQYFVGNISVEGESLIPESRIKKLIGLKPGEVFNRKKYEEGISAIYAEYSDSGHIHANIESEITKDELIPGDTSKVYASISLKISEGAPAYVHLINIKGNNKTFDKVIRRELVIKPGEIFRRNKLMRSLRNLYYLNYFEEITPEWEILENGDVDLTIRVKEKAVGSIQGGVGYNAVDHLVGTIALKIPNLLGRGWDSSLDLEFGSRRVDVSLSFTEPYLFDTPTQFGFDMYSTRWKWEGYYTEQREGGGVRLGRKLTWPDDYFAVSGSYHFEGLRYYDFSASYTPTPAYDLRKEEWPQYRSSVGLALTRDSRDNQFFATQGSLNSVSLEMAGGPLLGDDEYQKLIARSYWYFPVFKYLSVVAKGRWGALVNLWHKNKRVPFSERFFAGGISPDGQLRGYVDRSISPTEWSTAPGDTTGRKYEFKVGGQAVLILSAELRVPAVKDQLYISVFADAGDVWLKPKQTSLSHLKKSVGVGTRFIIPMMGILGIDVGYGFQRPEGGSIEVHFQLGPEQ